MIVSPHQFESVVDVEAIFADCERRKDQYLFVQKAPSERWTTINSKVLRAARRHKCSAYYDRQRGVWVVQR